MQRNVIVQIKLIKLFYCTSNSQLKKREISPKVRGEKMHYYEASSRSLLKYEEQEMQE
jgi:hypothetical protein